MTDNTVNIGGPVPPRKIYQNPDAEAETLTIIGTAYKGPAFVPQQVVQQGNSNDIKNTFVGIFGDSEKNRYRNLKDEYDYHIDSQGFIASENWFQNGGDQVSYTRVLGIGTGIKDDDGLYIDSGFNVSNLISSGSIKRSGDNFYSNPYSVAGGHNGSLSFLIKRFKNKIVDSNTIDGFKNYLSELGISADTKKLITDVIISPSGVVPTIHESSATNLPQDTFTNEINDIEGFDTVNSNLRQKVSLFNFNSGSGLFGSYKGKTRINRVTNIYLYLNGFNNNNIYNVIKISDDSNRFVVNNKSYFDNQTKNYFNNRILDKGNLFYSTFQCLDSLLESNSTNDNDHNIHLLTTKKHSEISNNTNLPDYNDFTDRFRTAKTPWITSQPVNRVGIEDNREVIHEKVVKLFKIFAIDDGAVGNRYRIKIHPKEIFDKDDDKYSVFSLYIFEYSVINNTYTQVEEYIDLDLDPNSKNFIGRRIGTQYQYYDINKKRVYTVGDYPLISSHIRVLLSDEVNKSMIEKKCIPSGFESYPHINFNKESFSHYSAIDQTFYDSLGDIQQMPITYFPCFVYDHDMSSNDFNNTWGPLFFNITEKRFTNKQDLIKKEYYKVSDSSLKNFEIKKNQYVRKNESEIITFSPHYFYTKYYQSNNNNINKNVLIDEVNWMNSFFHLEKIIYPVSKDDSNNRINDFPEAIYKRSGKKLDSSYLPDGLHRYYKYVNIDEVLNESKNENYRIDSRLLTFDLFTYGGFDGTNILDYDKKSLNNNAIARERFREDKEITSNSYIHAIGLSTKYENCLGDILLIPGIKEEKVVKKALVEIKEENRLLYCADISGLTTSNEIVGSFYKTRNIVNRNRNSSLIIDIEEDSEGIRTNPYRELVKTNFSNFSLFDRTNFESRSFVPLLGELIDEERKIVICPSVYVSGLMAKSIGEEMNSVDLQYTFGSELLDNENFKSVNKNFTVNEKRFKKNGLNIIFEDNSPLSSTSTKLLTYNTTFGIRNSVYRQASTTRILNNIKKRLEYLLILGPRSILFDSASSINNIHQKVKYLINSVMEEIKDEGIIEDFSVVVPQDEYSNENSDIVENILRGKVYLKLSNTTKDNEDLNTISLGELNKEIKSLTNELENIRILSIK